MANNRFQHKRSTVSGVVPTTGDLTSGELGINLVDRKLFTANSTAVFELGSNLSILSVTGNTSLQNFVDIKTYVEAEAAPTISSNTLTLDLASATIFDVSLNSPITTLTLTNVSATASKAINFVLIFTADGTARAVTWPASFRWPGNTAPTITFTPSGKRDIFTFLSTDNGTTWNAFVSGQNL